MDVMEVALRTLRSHAYGFLATAAGSGPGLRLVQHLKVDDDATVWIGTSPRSRKAREIASAPRVAYAVEDRTNFAYATVLAAAVVVTEIHLRRSLWEPGLSAFFPDGPDGDDFVLLRLASVEVEVMSFADGVHPHPYGLKAAVAKVRVPKTDL